MLSSLTSSWFMTGLDLLMISYTLWVISLSNYNRAHTGISAALIT